MTGRLETRAKLRPRYLNENREGADGDLEAPTSSDTWLQLIVLLAIAALAGCVGLVVWACL